MVLHGCNSLHGLFLREWQREKIRGRMQNAERHNRVQQSTIRGEGRGEDRDEGKGEMAEWPVN